jgi:nucleoside-diphosphate-sugar epimerase
MIKGTICITGSQGFIGSYLCSEFLNAGYKVIGIDNYSKYGRITRRHDKHENFRLYEFDLSEDIDWNLVAILENGVDYLIAGAAMIGGISYFHKYAYDLLATNERILANTFDAAIKAFNKAKLQRIIVLSSSMVFEQTDVFPTPEWQIGKCPPPLSTYGFQKLSCEYFCKGAWEQYKLPYTIIRPFNVIGIGEDEAVSGEEIYSGNIKILLSHVIPDLVTKILKGQNPLHILGEGNQVRHYTNGKDLARAVHIIIESRNAVNEDFNISHPTPTTVLELAQMIWHKIRPYDKFEYISKPSFKYDVQLRSPLVEKARQLLGFEAKISLGESLDEIIPYYKKQIESNIL